MSLGFEALGSMARRFSWGSLLVVRLTGGEPGFEIRHLAGWASVCFRILGFRIQDSAVKKMNIGFRIQQSENWISFGLRSSARV